MIKIHLGGFNSAIDLQDVGYEQVRSLVSENALPAAFSPWDIIHRVLMKAKKESWQDERFLLDGVHKQQAPPLRRRCPPNRRSLESGQAGDSGGSSDFRSLESGQAGDSGGSSGFHRKYFRLR